MREPRPRLAFFAFCSLMACNSIIGIDGDYELAEEGGGGEGGSGGGDGGGVACVAAGECPDPTTPCRVANCIDKVCGVEIVPEGAGCSEGDADVCNADGECVECLGDGDCQGNESCVAGICEK